MQIPDSNKKRQSEAIRGGAHFENHIKDTLNKNSKLIEHKIEVFDGKELIKMPNLLNQILLPLPRYQPNWRDLNLTAVDKDRKKVLAVISCKLSLHGRFPETLFYSLVYKEIYPKVKVILVTPDKGNQKNPAKWRSEWGNEKKPTKNRALVDKYLFGVYIENRYLNDYLHISGETQFGGKVKPFSNLVSDIIYWKSQV